VERPISQIQPCGQVGIVSVSVYASVPTFGRGMPVGAWARQRNWSGGEGPSKAKATAAKSARRKAS